MNAARVMRWAVLWALVVTTSALADEPQRSDAEFDRLCQQLHVKRQPWASIPWQTSLTAARQKAARERKPIFFNVNTGNALGFT